MSLFTNIKCVGFNHKCPFNNFRYNEKKIGYVDKAEKADFVAIKNVYQAGKAIVGSHNVLTNKKIYNIFEVQVLIGNPHVYLLCLNEADVRTGDQIKFLMPLKAVFLVALNLLSVKAVEIL